MRSGRAVPDWGSPVPFIPGNVHRLGAGIHCKEGGCGFCCIETNLNFGKAHTGEGVDNLYNVPVDSGKTPPAHMDGPKWKSDAYLAAMCSNM